MVKIKMVQTRSKNNKKETIVKKESKIVKKTKKQTIKKKGDQAVIKKSNLDLKTIFDLTSFLTSNKWKELLKDEFEKDYFKKINETLNIAYRNENIYPPKELIFNAFNLTDLENVTNKKKYIFLPINLFTFFKDKGCYPRPRSLP
jgi:hypothetical protein